MKSQRILQEYIENFNNLYQLTQKNADHLRLISSDHPVSGKSEFLSDAINCFLQGLQEMREQYILIKTTLFQYQEPLHLYQQVAQEMKLKLEGLINDNLLNEIIQKNKVTVHIWEPQLKDHCVGHVSIETQDGYLSFWPDQSSSGNIFFRISSIASNFLSDVSSEKGRLPISLNFYTLDALAINSYCAGFVFNHCDYALIASKKSKKGKLNRAQPDFVAQNCCTVSLKALHLGGIGSILPIPFTNPGETSWKLKHLMNLFPGVNQIKEYCQEAHKIEQMSCYTVHLNKIITTEHALPFLEKIHIKIFKEINYGAYTLPKGIFPAKFTAIGDTYLVKVTVNGVDLSIGESVKFKISFKKSVNEVTMDIPFSDSDSDLDSDSSEDLLAGEWGGECRKSRTSMSLKG